MKRTFKRILASLLTVVMLLTAAPLSGFVGLELPDFGAIFSTKADAATSNEEISWSFDESTATLTFSGTGALSSNRCDRSWYNSKDNIRTVVINEGITSIGQYFFDSCTMITKVVISNGVKSIGTGAFGACLSLGSITIPETVTSIGYRAFYQCRSLSLVNYLGSREQLSEISIGNDNSYFSRARFKCAPSDTWGNDLFWSFDEKIDTLIIWGSGAMWDFHSGESPWLNIEDEIINIVINEGVTSIGDYAFDGCSSLTSVEIPDSVTSIGDYAFSGCTSLTSIEIPGSATSIGGYVFYGCTSITSIEIPDGVTSIGVRAFSSCTSLTSITIPNSVTSIGSYAFSSCTSLTSIEIPDSVTTIGDYAFGFCNGLASITIPDSVTSIGSSAFYNCTGLISVTIPDSVTTIGDDAFSACYRLMSINVDSDNQYYSSDSYDVLYNKDKTILIQYPCGNARTSFIIPDSVTTIGDYGFYYCDSLINVTIPDSVTTIGVSAFRGCNSLTDVYYSGTEEQWNGISIASRNESLSNATIHFNSSGNSNPDTPDDFTESIKLGTDRFSFGQDMTGTAGETLDALLVYASKENDINDLTITSSNPAVATVGAPKIDTGDYITQENEMRALVPITLKSAGTATITVTSPTGVSESIVINVTKKGNSNKYSTYTGILESTVWSVADPESWVSEITVDGTKYSVKKNLISIESGNSAENKEVVFVVENGLVVWFDTIENIKVGINVGLSFPTSQLTYYEGKFSEENLTLKVGISSTCLTDFPGDLSVLNDVLDANLLLDKITLTASAPLSFNGSKIYTIDASSTKVYFGKTTIVATLNVELDKKYMETSQETVYAGVSCDVTGIQSGIKFKDSTSTSIIITKLKNSKPTSNQNSASAVNTAAQKLEAIAGTSAATINGDITGTLNKLFTSEEREMIALTLLSEAALLCIPEEKLDLSSKVFEKVMGIKSSWFGAVRNKEIAVTFTSKTDAYGEIEVKFTCKLSNYEISNTRYAFYGTIDYEIVGGKGRKNLTDDMVVSGLAGNLAGADVTAFTNAIYEVADDMIKSSYEFGDSANDAAEIIFGKTVDEILRQTKYAKHLSKVKKIIVACKEIIIKCPVNVYVYDSANQLVAAVENNKVVLTNENAEILVNGDVKTVWLYDDTYRIEYQSLAEYDMSVTINEYGYSDCLLRTVEINKIPLKIGTNFTQTIDESVLEEADYILLSNDNQSYSADSDVCHLHNHTTTMKWELIQEATDTKYGIKVAICDLCNDWYKEIIPIVKGKVNSVSVNDISMSYKDGATLTPSISADAGVKYTVSYSSSNDSVVSVDQNGNITTRDTGSATITVTVTDEYGNTVADTCDVSVKYTWWQWIIVIVLFGWIWY